MAKTSQKKSNTTQTREVNDKQQRGVQTMNRQEIAQSDWVNFFDRFSMQHEGWLATLSVKQANGQERVIARERPFQSAATNLKKGGDRTISIVLANTKTEMITHNPSNVERVYLLQHESGAHAGLMLEAAGGEQTLLRFRSPVPAETVDGLVGGA